MEARLAGGMGSVGQLWVCWPKGRETVDCAKLHGNDFGGVCLEERPGHPFGIC